MKATKSFIKIFLSVLGVLILILSILIFIFSQKLEKFAVNAINEQLNAKAEVAKIDFTIWKTFPFAAVNFKNVIVHSGNDCLNKNAPDVIKAENIYCYFNWFKLLSAKMQIDRIKIEKAEVFLWISDKNEKNFLILKKSNEQSKTDFNITNISFKDCVFKYTDAQINISILLKNAVASNLLNNINWNISAKTEIEYFTYSNLLKLKDKSCNIDGILMSQENNLYTLQNIRFNINEIKFFVDGKIRYAEEDKFSEVDLKADTRNASLDNLISIIPLINSVKQDGLESGKFNFKTSVRNIANKGYEVNSAISIENGNLKKDNVTLRNINGNLIFSLNTIDNIWRAEKISLSANTYTGNISLKGYSRGKEVKSESKFDIIGQHKLEEISPFIKQDLTNVMYGDAEYKLNVFIQKNGKKISYSYLGNGSVKNFLTTTKSEKKIKVDFINANFNDESILVSLNDIELNKSKFNVEADVTGFGLYNAKVIAKTKIFGQNINADEIIELIPKNNNEKSEQPPIKFDFYGDIQLSRFNINNYKLENLNTQFQYDQHTIFCKSFKSVLCGGNIEGKVRIDNVNHAVKTLSGDVKYDKVNINELFSEFNNFGQDFLVADNLRGLVSGNTTFKFDLKKDGKPIEESISAKSNVKIEKGELIQFTTLKQLSRFIEIKELENIVFQTLENDIIINNRQINIPLMKVNSNVLNFNMKGTHSFDQDIDYHFMFLLKDVIAKRFKEKNSRQETEFGIIEKTELGVGLPVYVMMTGKAENPKIRYDHKEGIKRIEFEIARETKEIKRILNKDFGLFKNETFEEKETQKENFFEKNSFSIDFDDEQKKDVSKEQETRKKNKTDSKIRKKEFFKEKPSKKEETTDDYL